MSITDIPVADRSERDFPVQEPIAVIGIGCRYSGDINNLEDFWKMLLEKRSTLTDFPEDRFAEGNQLVDPERGFRKMVTKRGGWLKGLKEFDAQFFKISPREAEKVDPHQRLMLEVTFEAFEDAGIKPDEVWGSRTGVYAGMWSSDFEHVLMHSKDDIDVYSTTGSGRYAAAGRLAYFFNLQGPTFTIDTACSTSLVAVHLASQSLHLRECDMAVCAAANLILNPFISIGYSRSRLLSDYGKCRFGAVDASGYVRTEGAATVILKRLSDAVKDGDHIHAVIPGTAVNSDGQSHKYMLAPSAITQEIMIRDALKRAGVQASEVQYVEAHGTGTKAGDPSELASIPAALLPGRDPSDKFYVGSIKTNLGHTEAASGFAGMIKTILAIQNRTIPANLYADEDKNPNIPWDSIPLEIPADAKPWPHPERPLLAGVNSFGISGTNAHVLLREWKDSSTTPEYHRNRLLFPLSAANEATLKKYAALYLQDVERLSDDEELLNYTINVAVRKADLQYRAVIIFEDKAGLVNGLQDIIAGKANPTVLTGYSEERKGTALVFPGQGAQWSGMGRQLYAQESVFKAAIDACAEAFAPYVSWSLTTELFEPGGMQTIDIIQPALVAMEIALARWWEANGLEFQSVIGHSMGEVAAAHIAGAITLDEAALIICTRSSLMRETSGQGAMGYVAIPPAQMQAHLQGKEHMISLGVTNSPSSCVISGQTDAVDALLAEFEQQGVFCRRVKVDVASHSPQMDPLLPRLGQALEHVQPVTGSKTFYSTVEAGVTNGAQLKAPYWVANLRKTVRFSDTIQLMAANGAVHFVEASPHPTLLQAITENAEHLDAELQSTGSLRREESEQQVLLLNLAEYFAKGGRLNWKKYYGTQYKKVSLPTYPFERKHYWVEEAPVSGSSRVVRSDAGAQPLLMFETSLPEGSPLRVWETEISLNNFPYLADHKIQETIVVPGAAYIEMMLEAAEEIAGPGQHLLRDVQLLRAMPLRADETLQVQLILQSKIENTYEAAIYSWTVTEDSGQWTKHALAVLEIGSSAGRLLPNALSLETIRSFCEQKISSSTHYQHTEKIELPYGPAFQTVDQLCYGENFIVASVLANKRIAAGTERYLLHPAMLDGCIQAYLSAMYTDAHASTFVPVEAGKILLHQSGKALKQLTAAIKITAESHDKITGNAVIYDANGELVAEMKGFTLARLEQSSDAAESLHDLLYEVVSQETTLPSFVQKEVAVFADAASAHLAAELNAAVLISPGDHFAQDGKQFTIRISEPADYTALASALPAELDTFVHALSLSAKGIEAFSEQERLSLSAVRMLQAFAAAEKQPRFWVLHHLPEVHPAQAVLPGMLHVWRNEHPEFRPSAVAFDHLRSDLVKGIIHSDTAECQWQIRDQQLSVARLQNPGTSPDFVSETLTEVLAGDRPFEVVTDEPGLIDRMNVRAKRLEDPLPHEVQVEVKAIGINFMNLMSALGIYPGKDRGFATLGIECAGVVTEVGDEVTHLKPGDRVLGMAYHTMSSHVNVHAALMRKIPEGMSFEDAATIPVVFLTVYYSLVTLARLQPGERVLIHAATGGVGLAAIQVAQAIGADIYATAGSEEKREWLRAQGIQHVYHSRTTDFADQILRDTSGEGVDVVLNSLTGSAMLASLELLRNFGRFVEIGKKDVYADSKIGLHAFSKGLSYFMVDFEKMIFEKPSLVGQLTEELLPYFEQGVFEPLQKKVFPVANAREAFHYMSTGKHIGKIVVEMSREGLMLSETSEDANVFNPHASYLITGGYGGLGLTFAAYLAERGARHLILTGRSGPKADALEKIQWLEDQGVEVIVEQADVANEADVARLINEIPSDYPLKGVFHLAGLLEDASVLQLEPDAFYRVLAPKVKGAFLLHEYTKEISLDQFVLFSSSTILFGSPGQTAYVGANAYMDALAEYRHAQNLPALSIQWGTVSEVGLAAASGVRADRLEEEGVAPLSPAECTALFEEILHYPNAVMGAFRFDLSRWQAAYPSAAKNPFYAELRAGAEENAKADAGAGESKQSFVDELRSIADAEQRMLMLEAKLREKVGSVVKLEPDQINIKTPFKSLGIDSLMSIQLKNQLEKTFGLSITVTSFWTYPNIKDYGKFISDKLQLNDVVAASPASEPVAEIVSRPSAPAVAPEIPDEDVSLDDLSKLLEDELNDL